MDVVNIGLRDELRLHGSGILCALKVFGLDLDADRINQLYWSFLMAKVIDTKCIIHWTGFTRFLTKDFVFDGIYVDGHKLREDEVAIYHYGNGYYRLDEDNTTCLAKIVWKRISQTQSQ
jgi:hypothetical protein